MKQLQSQYQYVTREKLLNLTGLSEALLEGLIVTKTAYLGMYYIHSWGDRTYMKDGRFRCFNIPKGVYRFLFNNHITEETNQKPQTKVRSLRVVANL